MNQAKEYPPEAIRILYGKRKPVLIVAFIAGLIAAIFTSPYFAHPIYRSETLLYPPNSNSHINMIAGASRFGSDKEIDEQIQMLKSVAVRDSVIKKYGMVQHYAIDTLVKTWSYQLYKEYDGNTIIDRTRYNSISVTVFDYDPKMAADIANDIVKFGDLVKNEIIKKNLRTALESLSKEQLIKTKEVDSVAHRLNELRSENLLSLIPYERQTDLEKFKNQIVVRELINRARAENNYTLFEMVFNFENKLNQLNNLQESYSQAYIDFISPVPESYVISQAEVSWKKVSPKRTVIVVFAFLGSIVIFWAWIVFYENLISVLRQTK